MGFKMYRTSSWQHWRPFFARWQMSRQTDVQQRFQIVLKIILLLQMCFLNFVQRWGDLSLWRDTSLNKSFVFQAISVFKSWDSITTTVWSVWWNTCSIFHWKKASQNVTINGDRSSQELWFQQHCTGWKLHVR